MARHAHENWNLPEGERQQDGSRTHQWPSIHAALLMDIRAVLREMLNVLQCRNTQNIPRLLTRIASNTDRFKCQVHKRYRAIRPPRVDCKECRRMYRRRHA